MPEPPESKPVVAIYGSERVTILEALEKLLSAAGVADDGGFDYSEMDGRSAAVPAILDGVSTAPFLSERRTVVLRRANAMDKAGAASLAKGISSLPASALLVLVFEPDDEAKDLSKDPLVVAAAKAGAAIACEAPQGAALSRQLMERAKAEGGNLTRPAADTLGRLVSGSLTLAVAELEKLLLYAGGETIDEHMVERVAAASQTWKVFELLDAVVQGKLGAALENLKYLLEGSSSAQEAAMRYLLPQLHRQVKLLWQAKSCQEEGISPDRASHILPKGRNLANAHSFVRDKLTRAAKGLTLDQASAMLRCILEADMRLKGQLPSASPNEVLGRLLAELCEIAQNKPTTASL